MFKASKKEINRLLDITSKSFKRNAVLNLSQESLRLIEKTVLLDIGEKMELILVSLGEKLTTEIYSKIQYKSQSNNEEPKVLSIDSINHCLEQLPFPYFIDSIIKKNKASGKQRKQVWFQVCLNETIAYFMKKYSNELTSLELGLMYGYPISAIRAFGGLIEQEKRKQPSLIDYFFSGVLSRNFNKEERKYFQCWWQKIKRVSPELARQALLDYRKGN